jgi:hypothetical protein
MWAQAARWNFGYEVAFRLLMGCGPMYPDIVAALRAEDRASRIDQAETRRSLDKETAERITEHSHERTDRQVRKCLQSSVSSDIVL